MSLRHDSNGPPTLLGWRAARWLINQLPPRGTPWRVRKTIGSLARDQVTP